MQVRHVMGACAMVFMAVAGVPDKAFALCGTVAASGQGETRQQAVTAANNKGLKETQKLDRNYGGRVKYETANLSCKESRYSWNCRITQKFCAK